MAVVFCDGFDLLATADLTLKWTTFQNAGGFNTSGGITISSGGRVGGNRLAVNATHGADTTTSTAAFMTKTLPSPLATLFLGVAVRCASATFFHPIFLRDSGNNVQFSMDLDGTLHPRLWKGSFSTLLITSTAPIALNTWTYWEIGVVVATSGGSATLKLNGVSTGTFSGNTQQSANANVQVLILGDLIGFPISTVQSYDFDDLYLADSSGSVNNSFLGDIRVIGLLPSAVGTNTHWTRVGAAATNWQSVNENPPNGDTTYVSSNSVGQIDTYAYPDVPSDTAAIVSVVSNFDVRKDDAGTRTVTTRVRSGGSEADAPGFFVPSPSYQIFQQVMDVNPVTSAGWTVAEVNAVEFGPKLLS